MANRKKAEPEARPERRRALRSPLLVLEVKGKHYNTIFVGQTGNISEGGLFLNAKRPLQVGDSFPVEFILPDNKTKISCTCEVVWTKRYGPGSEASGVGIRFVDLDDRKKKVIGDWVRRSRA